MREITVLLFLYCVTGVASAHQLSPQGTSLERQLATRNQSWYDSILPTLTVVGVEKFGSPVHEEITNRSLDCDGDEAICSDPDWDPALAYVLAGVRWNDDPPFRFESSFGGYSGCKAGETIRLVVQPKCWASVFRDGKNRAKKGEAINAKTAPLLVRSHFGDLQFLHSMGSTDGEQPDVTYKRVMMWAEFTWKVATKKIGAGDIVSNQEIVGIGEVFARNGWSVQDLFALGNPLIRKSDYLSAVAFGSLLHMVQDSFSKAHVKRESVVLGAMCAGTANSHRAPGRISEFHAYGRQDSKKHSHQDVRGAFSQHLSSGAPTVVEVGRTLAAFYQKQAPWDEVKDYVACVFAVSPSAAVSSPGDFAVD